MSSTGPTDILIDDKTFHRAQDKLAHNRKQTGKHIVNTPYALFSKTCCGYCGDLVRAYRGASSTGKEHFYYRFRASATKKDWPGHCH